MKLHSKLTPRQQQVLDYLRAFYEENDQLPPMQTIADHFGWKSMNSAATFTAILEAKGYIEKNAVGKFRFSRHQPDFSDTVPIASPVRCEVVPVRRYIGAELQ